MESGGQRKEEAVGREDRGLKVLTPQLPFNHAHPVEMPLIYSGRGEGGDEQIVPRVSFQVHAAVPPVHPVPLDWGLEGGPGRLAACCLSDLSPKDATGPDSNPPSAVPHQVEDGGERSEGVSTGVRERGREKGEFQPGGLGENQKHEAGPYEEEGEGGTQWRVEQMRRAWRWLSNDGARAQSERMIWETLVECYGEKGAEAVWAGRRQVRGKTRWKGGKGEKGDRGTEDRQDRGVEGRASEGLVDATTSAVVAAVIEAGSTLEAIRVSPRPEKLMKAMVYGVREFNSGLSEEEAFDVVTEGWERAVTDMARTWLGSGGGSKAAGKAEPSTAPSLGEHRNGRGKVAGREERKAEEIQWDEPETREPCQIECKHGWVSVGTGHAYLQTPECSREFCVQDATHWVRSWPGFPPRPPQEKRQETSESWKGKGMEGEREVRGVTPESKLREEDQEWISAQGGWSSAWAAVWGVVDDMQRDLREAARMGGRGGRDLGGAVGRDDEATQASDAQLEESYGATSSVEGGKEDEEGQRWGGPGATGDKDEGREDEGWRGRQEDREERESMEGVEKEVSDSEGERPTRCEREDRDEEYERGDSRAEEEGQKGGEGQTEGGREGELVESWGKEAEEEWGELVEYWGIETAVDRYPRRAARVLETDSMPEQVVALIVEAERWRKEGEPRREERVEEREAREEEEMRAGCDMRRGREESGEGRGDREQKKEERGIMEREVREEEIEEVWVEMSREEVGPDQEEDSSQGEEEGEHRVVGTVRQRRRPRNRARHGDQRETAAKMKELEERMVKKIIAADKRMNYRLRQWYRSGGQNRVVAVVEEDVVVVEEDGLRRRRFHSTTVKVAVLGLQEGIHSAVADGGAFGGFISANRVRHLPTNERGGRRAGGARTASGASLGKSEGYKKVRITLPESDHPELIIQYEMDVIDNDAMPTLLGVDLFAHLGAKFDYLNNSLSLEMISKGEPVTVKVPFTVERVEGVPERSRVCTVARVRESQTVLPSSEIQWVACTVDAPLEELHAWRTYEVSGMEDEEEGNPEDGGEEEGPDEAEEGGGERRDAPRRGAIINQLARVHWGRGDTVATVFVPVMNDTGEPMLFLEGDSVVRVEELEDGPEAEVEVDVEAVRKLWRTKEERGTEEGGVENMVAWVNQSLTGGSELAEGVVGFILQKLEEEEEDADGMKKGDWRYQKGGRDIIEMVEDRKDAFQEWREEWEKQVKFGEEVREDDREGVLRLLFAFKETVAVNPKAPPAVRGVEHAIKLVDGWDQVPKRVRLRPHSPKEFEAVGKEVQGMLDNGIVRPSKSPWACSVVLVPKPDGSLRTCCDFRQLNALTVADAMTIPRIDDMLDRLGKASAISALDMAAGYHAVPMREEDIEKTAFLTWSHGLLEWVRMPMGLKNSGATYQRMLQHILGPLLWESSSNYLDDLSIFSVKSDHIEDLTRVLKRLAKWGVTVKISKCIFFANRMPFLGYLVRVGEGIGVDPEKVEACLRMGGNQGLKTVTDVRSFMGAMEYYRRFVPDYAELSAPLRRLIKGKKKRCNVETEWAADPECELCFRALKTALVTAPVLAFPDFGRPFIVSTDASYGQIAAILMQLDAHGVERPVAFAGRQLTECEQRYCVADKECLAVVFAMCRKFRRYLYGSPFPVTLITDNTALITLTTRKDPYGRLLRYALELSELEYVVKHRPGVKHLLPDVMSRSELVGAPAEEIAEQVDQALKSRCALLLEKGREGYLGSKELEGIFSEKQRALRLQLLVRGSVAAKGEGYETVIQEVREAHRRLQEEDLERLGKMSGEWFPFTEWSPAVACVNEVGVEEEDTEELSGGVKGYHPEEEWWELPGQELTMLAAALTRSALRRSLEGASDGKKGQSRAGISDRTFRLAETVPPEVRRTSRGGREGEPQQLQVSTSVQEVGWERELVSGPALQETPRTLEQWKQAFQVSPRETMVRAQDLDVFASSLRRYLRTNQLPQGDPYLSARLVKVEDHFFVSEGGLLCRMWWRDPRRKAKLDPVYQIYVPEELRGAVMVSFHGGSRSGHLSPLKTWMRIKERFWWPGMQADVFVMVQECGVCQTRGRRPPKQQIQGHVTSQVPGEVWMLDVLHFPESSTGKKYVLTMIDVATRWAHFAPMDRVDSFAVVKAIEDRLIGEGVFPRLFITDNGSEFKKAFKEFCELYSVKIRRSVPHHAEGHGMVEAANRTISDIIGHMVEEDGGDWEMNLPWARRAYLSAVHSALQAKDGGGLTPQEAYLGRSVQLAMEIGLKEDLDLSDGDSVSAAIAEKAQKKILKALDWIRESKEDYEKTMRDSKRNRSRRERVFQVGDKVRLFKPSKSKLMKKVGRVYEGPYTIVECIKHQEVPSEYVLKRDGASSEGRVRATAEQLRTFLEASVPKALQTVEEIESVVEKAAPRQYAVRAILDEAGNNRSKSYLVAWEDGSQPTWEPEALLRAPELVAEFHRKKHTRRTLGMAAAVQGRVEVRGSQGRVKSLKMDLMKSTPAESWRKILDAAGVGWDEVLLVWASPPCQTFSPADYSNISRGHAFRDHSDPHRPPTKTNRNKAEVARQHDELVQHIMTMQEYAAKKVAGIACFLENPRGSLACREYMGEDELDPMWRRSELDQCAFGRDYKKSTHLWHNLSCLTLVGVTGDGKCHGRCGKGHMVGGYYKHFKALAMEPIRGPRGPGHTQEKNALPQQLLEVLLEQVIASSDRPQATVVVDLCAGFQSWRSVAVDRGYEYVAVDLLGDRSKKKGGMAEGTILVS